MRGVLSFIDVVTPANAEEPTGTGAAQLIGAMRTHAGEVVEHLSAMREALADLPGYAQQALGLLTDLQGLPALGEALLDLIVVAAAGALSRWALGRALRRARERVATPPEASVHIGAVSVNLVLDLVGIVVFLAVANATTFLFFDRFDPRRELVVAILLAISAAQVAGSVSRAVLSPTAPQLRLLALDDHVARGLQRWIIGAAGLAGFGYFGGGLLGILAMPPELTAAWDIVLASMLGLLVVAWIWINRWSVAATLDGDGVAQSWHAAATAFIGMVWLLWCYKRLLGRTDEAANVLLSALVILAVPVVDRLVRRLLDRLLAPWPGQDAEMGARLARAVRVVGSAFRVLLGTMALAILVETWGGRSSASSGATWAAACYAPCSTSPSP